MMEQVFDTMGKKLVVLSLLKSRIDIDNIATDIDTCTVIEIEIYLSIHPSIDPPTHPSISLSEYLSMLLTYDLYE